MAFTIGLNRNPGIRAKVISKFSFEYITFDSVEELKKFLTRDDNKHYYLSNNAYRGTLGRKFTSLEELESGDFIIIKEYT